MTRVKQAYGVIITYVLLYLLTFGFAAKYAVNWIYIDDLSTLSWFKLIDEGKFGFLDLFDAWDNQHPLGTQVAVMYLMRAVFGLSIKSLIYLSFAIVTATATLASLIARKNVLSGWHNFLAILLCFSLAFQMTQTEHLLWSFELGWFLVNLALMLNIFLTERLKTNSAAWVSLLCAAATFSSAQGAFTWLAAAMHYFLAETPARRYKVGGFAVCGGIAVGRVIWHSRAEQHSTSWSPDSLLGLGVYFVQIFGGAFAFKNHIALFIVGACLLVFTTTLATQIRRGSATEAQRAGAVLIFSSILSVASFSKGRFYLGIDWATTAFHAAPLLVPFYLGSAILIFAALGRVDGSRGVSITPALALGCMLATGVACAIPYGIDRAQTWTANQGYARWATCETDFPLIVQAKASGLERFPDAFAAVMPALKSLCGGDESALAMRLTRQPDMFAVLGKTSPQARQALDIIWQDYATDPGLQRALPIEDAETPGRLIGFVKSTMEHGDRFDAARLSPFRSAILAMP